MFGGLKYISVVYAHILNQKLTKLDDKNKRLIGYDEKSKAYNFYDHITKNIHVSCDV